MALSFSGTNYFYTQEAPSGIDDLTQYTAMCWARPLRLSGSSGGQACFSRQVGTGAGETIWLGFLNNTVNSYTNTTGGSFGASGGSPVIGAWQHLAVTYNNTGTRLRVFLNGAEVATGTGTGTLSATTRGLFIAGNNIGSTPLTQEDGYLGEIEDIRIYDRVLGTAVINTIIAGRCKDGIREGLRLRLSMIGPVGVSPSVVANLQGNNTLSLITRSGTPSYVAGVTVDRGRPLPRNAIVG